MQKIKFYLPCLAASVALFAGNFLPTTSSQPLTDYPHAQVSGPDDPGGLLIIDKKWIFPTRTNPAKPEVQNTVNEVLAIYGQ